MLQDKNGNWVYDQATLRIMIQDFFISLFESEGPCDTFIALYSAFPTVKAETMEMLRHLLLKKTSKVVFAMAPYKAAGPNGFHTGFYQKC